MTKLEEYKSQEPAIVGSSTINHAARVKLGLNCSEYCLIDLVVRKKEKSEHFHDDDAHIYLGFNDNEVMVLVKSLIMKGFLLIQDDKYVLTDKWANGFADIEKEFDNLFWKKDGKVCWTGTRKKALEYWIKIRKRHALEFLVGQRDKYFMFLELQKKYRGFDQQRVMCQVFLNPANERYLEDYTTYVADLKKKYEPDLPTPKRLTREDIISAYGKDNIK